MQKEQRRYIRFRPQENAYASLGSSLNQVGRIVDIGIGGLAFEYLSDQQVFMNGTHVDIFLTNDQYYLSDLPCQMVCNITCDPGNTSRSFSSGIKVSRCSLAFGELSKDQWSKLVYFLKNHTVGTLSHSNVAEDLEWVKAGD